MEEYKNRIKLEYLQLKERYEKLEKFLVSNNDELLQQQKEVMLSYLSILEKRAEHEKINLED